MGLIRGLVQHVSALVSAKPSRCREHIGMARWLKTGALLLASLGIAFALIVPSAALGTITSFSCGQVFGVNGTSPTYSIVGFQDVSRTYLGFKANVAFITSSCGNNVSIPGATSVFPQAISPDGFMTGIYEASDTTRPAFVMDPQGNVLSFKAANLSGDANAYGQHPNGITVSTGGIAWVVGSYLTNKGKTSHSFAVQVNTSASPTIVSGSWISFDISVAGSGTARGVDGADPASVIVGSYPDASGKDQGFVLNLADLKAARQAAPQVTVIPLSSVATLTCSGAIGGRIHGISDGGRIVGVAFTGTVSGYAYWVDGGPWTKGSVNHPVCNQIPVPGASKGGETWASGVTSDGVYIVGQGGSADWVYQP
ncbi:MAG TPA: hypothetical protein VFL28_01385 [bacterium]|nr:hypothetical protein [bacterium]